MLLDLLFLVIGLGLLVVSADNFVLGAARLAETLDIPRVVIGAVVVGFGTSAPEMLVSGLAAADGERALGVGNVVGSNVANLSLVLAAGALVTRLAVTSRMVRREMPLSLVATGIFAALFVDGEVTRWEGVILFVLLIAVVLYLLRADGNDPMLEDDFVAETSPKTEALRALAGLVGTIVGAQLVVSGASGLADAWGISGGFVGFSLVALGTSLPELVTTFVGARRGETDLIIGNLFGSNMFNSLAVGGVIGLAGPGPIDDDRLTGLGIAVMLVVCLLAYFISLPGLAYTRLDGIALFVAYVVSMVLLGAGAADDESSDEAAPTASAALSADDASAGPAASEAPSGGRTPTRAPGG